MVDTSLIRARDLKFEILEALKSWVILNGDGILLEFKSGDRKGTFLATNIFLRNFLLKVLAPKMNRNIEELL